MCLHFQGWKERDDLRGLYSMPGTLLTGCLQARGSPMTHSGSGLTRPVPTAHVVNVPPCEHTEATELCASKTSIPCSLGFAST